MFWSIRMRSASSYFLMKLEIKIRRAGEFLIRMKYHNQFVSSNKTGELIIGRRV